MQADVRDDQLGRLVGDLKAFSAGGDVAKALRKRLREPVPEARRRIRDTAVAILPHRHGLNQWIASSKTTASIRLRSQRSAGLSLRVGRNSSRKRSDVRKIDAGEVRAPSWGRRGRGEWHAQAVTGGFATDTVSGMVEQWRAAAIRAADDATRELIHG